MPLETATLPWKMQQTILVVDDNDGVRTILLQTLRFEGYEVLGASDGMHGLKIYNTRHFDLVITDQDMPGMMGIELISRIRTINPVQACILMGSESTDQPVYTDPHQPSVLSADVTRGSGGIAGGVSHQSVLGPAGLPEREVIRPGSSGPDGGAATDGQTSAATPAGVRSQEAIQELLDSNKGAMYTLYNRELRRDASLQGKLVVSITIAPAGHVTRCVILSSELGSASLEQQLVALIKGIDFGHLPGAAVVTTKIPIEFFPR